MVDDVFENNDSTYQAANLGSLSRPASISNLVMADRHDWYRFQMNGPGSAADYVGESPSSTSKATWIWPSTMPLAAESEFGTE